MYGMVFSEKPPRNKQVLESPQVFRCFLSVFLLLFFFLLFFSSDFRIRSKLRIGKRELVGSPVGLLLYLRIYTSINDGSYSKAETNSAKVAESPEC